MTDTIIGVHLRGDDDVSSHVDAPEDGSHRWLDVRSGDGDPMSRVTFFFPKDAEDANLICDMLIAGIQRIKDSLPVGIR